jgi:NitT/TauT family transport system substrate-binding protein
LAGPNDRKQYLRAFAAVLLMLFATLWATPSQALDKVKISAFQGAFVALPLYVAQTFKLFEKHGIEVELIYGTGIQVTNILVSGSSDFGAFAIEHGITILGKGQDVKLLAVAQSAPPYGIIVRNDVPTPNKDKPYPEMIKDLKGLKMGITTVGAGTDTALRFLLKQAGLTPNDVKIVPVGGQAQQVAGIKNGLIDGAIAVEPAQSEAVNGMKIAKMLLDIQGGQGPAMFTDYAYNGLWTTGGWLQKNPDKAKAVVAAIVDAETMIDDPAHTDEVFKVAADNMRGFDPVLLRAFIEKYRGIYQPVATPQQIGNVEKFLQESELLKDPIPYEKVVATDVMPKEFPKAPEGPGK